MFKTFIFVYQSGITKVEHFISAKIRLCR